MIDWKSELLANLTNTLAPDYIYMFPNFALTPWAVGYFKNVRTGFFCSLDAVEAARTTISLPAQLWHLFVVPLTSTRKRVLEHYTEATHYYAGTAENARYDFVSMFTAAAALYRGPEGHVVHEESTERWASGQGAQQVCDFGYLTTLSLSDQSMLLAA